MGTILASMGIKSERGKVADWIMIFLTIAIEFGAVAGPALVFESPRKSVPITAKTASREIGWIEDLKRAAANPSFTKLNYNEDGTISATYRCTAKAFGVSSIATVKSWLEQLEAQGFIERLSGSRGQTIRILKAG